MNEVPLDQLSAARFSDLVQTRFRVLIAPGQEVQLELSAVTITADNRRPSDAGREFESFSLLFNGPADVPLDQRTYRFAHERLGWFDLFIVPVSAERNARQYEAVFNRRTSSPETH